MFATRRFRKTAETKSPRQAQPDAVLQLYTIVCTSDRTNYKRQRGLQIQLLH